MPKKEMNINKIKEKLKFYFKKCADGRDQLKKNVTDAMNKGFTKEEILVVLNEITSGDLKEEASLCSVTIIGQALSYKVVSKKEGIKTLKPEEKENLRNKLKKGIKKCALDRQQLRKYIASALSIGLTKEELLAITDDIVGGLGKNEVSVCAIVAVDEVLRYEEINKLKKTIKMFAPYMEFNE